MAGNESATGFDDFIINHPHSEEPDPEKSVIASGIFGAGQRAQGQTTLYPNPLRAVFDPFKRANQKARMTVADQGVRIQRDAPAKATFKSIPIGQTVSTQVLPYDPERRGARLWISSNNSVTTSTNNGNATPGPATVAVIPPGTTPYNFVSMSATFTTDAVVANRQFTVQVLTPGLLVIYQATSPVITASTVTQVMIVAGQNPGVTLTNGVLYITIPSYVLQPGSRINLVSSGFDAGDQFTNITNVIQPTVNGLILGPKAEVENYLNSGAPTAVIGVVMLPIGPSPGQPFKLEYAAVSELWAISLDGGTTILNVINETFGGQPVIG